MITVNMEKAKAIGHNIRRAAREAEFAPYDAIIAKQIPGQLEAAEISRQAIRDKYAIIQLQIEASKTPEDIKIALNL